MRQALAWVLFQLGRFFGVLMMRPILGRLGGPLYSVYNRLMLKSMDLDRDERIWKPVR